MPRSFRAGRFTSRKEIGEDVNPSAYIVNLADCMLVFAVGVIVALVSYWNIDISPTVEEIQQEELEEIDPETMPEELGSGGSFYQEAGTAYRDPSTGILYLLTEVPEGEGADSADEDAEASGEDAASSDEPSGGN